MFYYLGKMFPISYYHLSTNINTYSLKVGDSGVFLLARQGVVN